MKKIYIIAGPNGAGKTTASYTFLPEIIDCNEYVNADEIAKGLSPFNADKIGIKAGRLMLSRMKELLEKNETFAIETTLALKSYASLIQKAKKRGYEIILIFLSLNSVQLAIKRVKTRVAEGGHDIPNDTIKRRYKKGLLNFFNIYIPLADEWLIIDNSGEKFQLIAEGTKSNIKIKNNSVWLKLQGK
ncbi:MAG: zeta toxin family protein [Candidatus Marinimicrobia bacterium]|nr:zeta toxin family protein [Candidatus Neomarinimicrobiota bacterium]